MRVWVSLTRAPRPLRDHVTVKQCIGLVTHHHHEAEGHARGVQLSAEHGDRRRLVASQGRGERETHGYCRVEHHGSRTDRHLGAMQMRETLTVIRADCLAATTGWLPSKGSVAIRLVRLRAPVIGGWQAAGFGHAYRSEDPQIALCGVNLDGYHHWTEPFDEGAFDRCQDCVAVLEGL